MPGSRIRVLSLLLSDPVTTFYLREISRLCGLPVRAVQRELALYESMALCERIPRGKQVFFRVRTDHPLYVELRALVLKAAAVNATPPPLSPAPPPLVTRTGLAHRRAPAPSRRADSWRVW